MNTGLQQESLGIKNLNISKKISSCFELQEESGINILKISKEPGALKKDEHMDILSTIDRLLLDEKKLELIFEYKFFDQLVNAFQLTILNRLSRCYASGRKINIYIGDRADKRELLLSRFTFSGLN